ncbi:allophanate hydrolase [Sinomonas atrocyanea]|uniref:Allophanate hydrolase n=1 Tax=Sinomonas atrocyanea TaxID=37927 RepID=A0A127A6D5_9MICC|nr:carboxyltransferase domain-containing protein [Sinomonas atrocyanea]AMM34636.1 allophanate hydrolase [Sinomonas atrocyanea]GEB63114.1 allophanate hydrolase [Sinomonas atrocyanea]GGG67315.1 allophanate hydrolase [Sinomonas atrocyanea]
MSTPALEREARYTWGGDEFLFVEVDEAMSLAANFKVMTLASKLSGAALEGVTDICPANASLLIRFNPDVLAPSVLEATVRGFEQDAAGGGAETLATRIVEVPVWYDDPFTAEVAQRFREGFHQEPSGTDLDYAAKVNGLTDAAEFIRRHHEQPWLVSMVGFVAGLPFLFQLVERQKQLEVPKYLSPRTDTPRLTVGHGGCFGAIYSVRGAGGYQMFGVAAAPIYDPAQTLADFKDFMVFFRPGDIVKFKPVTEQEYAAIQAEVENGTFRYRQAPVVFELNKALEDPERYNRELMEALDGM